MKKIYVVMMHTGTIFSRVVKTFTKYKYSHITISLDKSCDTVYSFGRRNPKSVLNGGYNIEKKDGEFFSRFHNTSCRVLEKEVTNEQYDNIQFILNAMNDEYSKYRYDYLGVVLRFFNIPVTFNYRYVCSQFVAYVLETAGIAKFNKKTCMVEPRDFSKLDGFKIIYEGRYCDYQ